MSGAETEGDSLGFAAVAHFVDLVYHASSIPWQQDRVFASVRWLKILDIPVPFAILALSHTKMAFSDETKDRFNAAIGFVELFRSYVALPSGAQ